MSKPHPTDLVKQCQTEFEFMGQVTWKLLSSNALPLLGVTAHHNNYVSNFDRFLQQG